MDIIDNRDSLRIGNHVIISQLNELDTIQQLFLLDTIKMKKFNNLGYEVVISGKKE